MWVLDISTEHTIVVFRIDNSDVIQGYDSGRDSEGVKHEKSVNH